MNQDQNIGPGLKHDSTVRANTNEKKEKSINKITVTLFLTNTKMKYLG